MTKHIHEGVVIVPVVEIFVIEILLLLRVHIAVVRIHQHTGRRLTALLKFYHFVCHHGLPRRHGIPQEAAGNLKDLRNLSRLSFAQGVQIFGIDHQGKQVVDVVRFQGEAAEAPQKVFLLLRRHLRKIFLIVFQHHRHSNPLNVA